MAPKSTLKTEGTVKIQVQDYSGTVLTEVSYVLTWDLAAIAAQLVQRALVSQGRPKRATGLQEAVQLVIKEVERKEL